MHLPACKTIFDVVGDLFADVCQVEESFLDDGIFGLLGKLSIRGRLLPADAVSEEAMAFCSTATETLYGSADRGSP